MKALSIRQPYAWAIVMGFKDVENRSWATHHRGPVLIHAGLREQSADVDAVLRRVADQTGTALTLIRNSYHTLGARGAIVGAATLTGDYNSHPSPWFAGPRAFVLETPARAISPVACRGQLGFFRVAADVLQRLEIPGYVER